jgi:hypothetical protein
MKKYYIAILALSILLGVYVVLDSFYTPIIIASFSSIPLYICGNKLALRKGLYTNVEGERAKDPFSRIKNWGISALPVISVIIAAFIDTGAPTA